MKHLFFEIIFFLLTPFIKKNKKLILFGTGFNKFTDSSKYLYLYFLGKDKYKVFWVTSNIKTYNFLKQNNFPVLMKNSVKTFFYVLKAYVFFVTHSYKDIYFSKPGNTIMINFWHAIPFKRFCRDADFKNRKNFFIKKRSYSSWDYIIVSEKKFIDIFNAATGVAKNKILPLGIPRNDIIFNIKKDENLFFSIKKKVLNKYNLPGNSKIILYAPTFRDSIEREMELNMVIQELAKSFLKKFGHNNYFLFIRKHNFSLDKEITFSDKIINASDYDDMQELLICADNLITDYSSSVFDYSILERKIILYVWDYNKFIKERGNLYFNLENLPFFKAYNCNEVLEIIGTENKKNKFQNNFNTYPACHNCFEFIQKLTG
ncbi:MAG: CDP-glycerol glycerophosphotransferase family protein [Candidatus Muiribacteriota bacterium]